VNLPGRQISDDPSGVGKCQGAMARADLPSAINWRQSHLLIHRYYFRNSHQNEAYANTKPSRPPAAKHFGGL
jgi:hypothetical protein